MKRKLTETEKLKGIENNLFVTTMQAKDLAQNFAELEQLSEWVCRTIKLFVDNPNCVLVENPDEVTADIIKPAMIRIKMLLEGIDHKIRPVNMAHYQIFLRDKE